MARRSLGIRVTGNGEQPDVGVWEVISGPLEEQQALAQMSHLLATVFVFGDRVLL